MTLILEVQQEEAGEKRDDDNDVHVPLALTSALGDADCGRASRPTFACSLVLSLPRVLQRG